MKPDRVVLDTSIFISLILSRKLDELVIWTKDYGIEVFICPELTFEIENVLRRKAIKKHLAQPVAAYLRFIKRISNESSISLSFNRAPDLKDNYLFDLAYTVKSHYIVTYDKPLLNMKQVNRIKIISLSEWRKLMKKVRE